jgi:phage terminase small subunit
MRGEVTEEVPVPTKNGVALVDAKAGVKDRTKAAELLGKRYIEIVEPVFVEDVPEED